MCLNYLIYGSFFHSPRVYVQQFHRSPWKWTEVWVFSLNSPWVKWIGLEFNVPSNYSNVTFSSSSSLPSVKIYCPNFVPHNAYYLYSSLKFTLIYSNIVTFYQWKWRYWMMNQLSESKCVSKQICIWYLSN